MNINKNDITCPVCGKNNTWQPDNECRPFCSPRCKLIDLGEWAGEKHRIAGEQVDLPTENNNPEDTSPPEKE